MRTINFNTPNHQRKQNLKALIERYESVRGTRSDSKLNHLLRIVNDHLSTSPERSDVIHDLLSHLAGEMIRMKTDRRKAVERFWTDLEGVTEGGRFEKLHKGKQERTLANRSEACAAFVDPESRNSRSLDASLSWNEEAFKDFAKILAGQIPNLSDLVGVYREYASEVQDFNRQLQRIDGLIDQIVYRLYGLTDEEIRIVEDDSP